ncbi:hypothetical protein ACP275_03G080800 [Erythranthe tilingii]
MAGAAAFWNMFPEWINPNNVGPENGPAATPILRMTRKVSYLCFGAAVALLVGAHAVLYTTNSSMKNKLHNMFTADPGYDFTKITFDAIFSITYIGILFSLAVKPNRTPIRFYRAVKFFVDVLILGGCTYLSETLDDAPSRVVAFLCILHILPAANLLCAYENVGLFDALLAVGLEATLTAARKHIEGEALQWTYVFLICSVLQAAKHTNEYLRDYVKASLEAARAADIELGLGVQANVVDAAAAAAGGNAGGAAAAGGNAGDAAGAQGNGVDAAAAQGNGVDAAAGGNRGDAARAADIEMGLRAQANVVDAAAAAGGNNGVDAAAAGGGGGGGDHGDNVAAGRVNHP